MRFIENTDQFRYENAELQPFPENLDDDKKTNGFAPAVRDHFLSLLPQVTINEEVDVILCPWCLEFTGHHATQVDHIIPKQIFLRYQLYKNRNRLHSNTNIKLELEKYLHDTDNLIICCNKCNNEKGDDFPKKSTMDDAIEFHRPALSDLSHLERKTQLAWEIMSVYMPQGDKKLFSYLAKWNEMTLSEGILTNNLLNEGEKQIRAWRAPGSGMPFKAHQVFEELVNHQLRADLNNWTGRLCFYCLGVYQDMAFQIDHIDSRLKGRNCLINNTDYNLLAVCRGCNGAKSDNIITERFLVSRIEERIERGWPGIESAGWHPTLSKEQTILRAHDIQKKLLNLHLYKRPTEGEINKFIKESEVAIRARKNKSKTMEIEE
ncbi:HNH endonuclease signature motif containing protein [Pantoea phytobeneficialis]|uniref:HNH endonuclease signature motif containing protein n=1 Tax=Pantoea phytobeneficialis TaxID=2052056 RepID=A0AAP9KS91_9GAMM|nr:HNH endonuclease signature motif containing protein [Pantoea phytobeneficialis]MDO6406501.1 HNH endonuclease signature motif containing protein [Pantoea phytobeneficialis]QGR09597.1 hypothetical protein CTZ24_24335 [Pantoea phytobeneficialis]